MSDRPLPRTFDAIAVVIIVQAHLVALFDALRFAHDYRSPAAGLALLAVSLAVPLACVAVARLRGGGDLPLPVLVAAGACLLAVDAGLAAVMRPDRVGASSMWSAVAVGVTLLALCPYRPPRDLIRLAGAHIAVIGVVLALHRDRPGVEPFAVIVALSAALVPAVAAAEFVRYFVRAAQRRADAVAEQARAQWRVLAAAAIADDADRRLARLRTEVLPLLADVEGGRREVDDAEGSALAQRLSADLRRELVEARSDAWLLAAPVAALEAPGLPGDLGVPGGPGGLGLPGDDGWPGIVLLDPDRLVARLGSHDRAALSAVLAALRTVGGWAEVSVALSPAYGGSRPDSPDGRVGTNDAIEEAAFVTVVARSDEPLPEVDPRVAAATDRAGCTASLEAPGSCVVEGRLPVQGSARLSG